MLGMLQNRLVALDRLLPLPAVGRMSFMVGCARHTFCRTVKLVRSIPRHGTIKLDDPQALC